MVDGSLLAAPPDTDRPFLIATGNRSVRSLVIENFEFAVAVLGLPGLNAPDNTIGPGNTTANIRTGLFIVVAGRGLWRPGRGVVATQTTASFLVQGLDNGIYINNGRYRGAAVPGSAGGGRRALGFADGGRRYRPGGVRG